jgi:hypothetical protein
MNKKKKIKIQQTGTEQSHLYCDRAPLYTLKQLALTSRAKLQQNQRQVEGEKERGGGWGGLKIIVASLSWCRSNRGRRSVFNEHRDLSKVRGIVEETTGFARNEEVVSNGRRQVRVFFFYKKKQCVRLLD